MWIAALLACTRSIPPAILDRPSRFDRKYHFNLPGEGEEPGE